MQSKIGQFWFITSPNPQNVPYVHSGLGVMDCNKVLTVLGDFDDGNANRDGRQPVREEGKGYTGVLYFQLIFLVDLKLLFKKEGYFLKYTITLETNTVLMQGKTEYLYLEVSEGSIQNSGLEIVAYMVWFLQGFGFDPQDGGRGGEQEKERQAHTLKPHLQSLPKSTQ